MSQNFAAASRPLTLILNRFTGYADPAPAANDNDAGVGSDVLLRDALKHFARYGLGAAEVARKEAERAFFADDRQGYRHWLGICRSLDRRMAAAVAARTRQPATTM